MKAAGLSYIETVASVAKAEGTPGPVTIRTYCDLGLVPYIRDANGRRLLRADAREIVRQIYSERLTRRGRPGHKATAA